MFWFVLNRAILEIEVRWSFCAKHIVLDNYSRLPCFCECFWDAWSTIRNTALSLLFGRICVCLLYMYIWMQNICFALIIMIFAFCYKKHTYIYNRLQVVCRIYYPSVGTGLHIVYKRSLFACTPINECCLCDTYFSLSDFAYIYMELWFIKLKLSARIHWLACWLNCSSMAYLQMWRGETCLRYNRTRI